MEYFPIRKTAELCIGLIALVIGTAIFSRYALIHVRYLFIIRHHYIYNTIIDYILSQWAWFSMSTRNFIGSRQNSAHPLLNDRWIALEQLRGVVTYIIRVNTAYHVTCLYANGFMRVTNAMR